MIRKVGVNQLRPGMFIHDFNCSWLNHPFLRNQLLVATPEEIRKIVQAGVETVFIDTERGRDIDLVSCPSGAEPSAPKVQEPPAPAAEAIVPVSASLADEMPRAMRIKQQACQLVRNVMHDVRLGKAIEMGGVENVVQNITESILRNPGALTGLLRIKSKDDYTFMHSVSVCTLLVAFCRSRGMDAETTRQAGLGGLLHDVGKAMIPTDILNKPGKLSAEEFAVVKQHPRLGHDILRQMPSVGPIPLDITLHHHERMDGQGYPDALDPSRLSVLARMAAVVDVYDAITSDRCYHKGLNATDALRRLHAWSGDHLDAAIVQDFMRCVGIYPVGTMVRLESGRLAVVIEPNAGSPLAPKVNAFFSTKSNTYIKPQEIDLAKPLGRGGGDRILSHEAPEKWRVDPWRFMAAAS